MTRVTDEDRPVKSPANRTVRTLVAGGFCVIWLVAMLWDFFANPGSNVLPFWFQATGLIVLGYLLGISADDITGGIRGSR